MPSFKIAAGVFLPGVLANCPLDPVVATNIPEEADVVGLQGLPFLCFFVIFVANPIPCARDSHKEHREHIDPDQTKTKKP